MDIALIYSQEQMAYDLAAPVSGDLAKQASLETAIIFSLFCDRRAEDDDVLTDPTDRRGWWADGTWGDPADRIGSKLWTIYGRPLNQGTKLMAKQFCEEALQWMIDDEVVAEVEVTTDIIGYDGAAAILGISIILKEATGNEILNKRFDTLWKELTDAV